MAIDDAVTRVEGRIDAAAQRSAERIKRMIRQRYNRPIFSEKVPREEQMLQYEFLRDNPSALAQFFKDQRASPDSAIHYVETMEKRRAAG